MSPEAQINTSEEDKGGRLARMFKKLRERLAPREDQTRIGRLGEIAMSGGMLLVLEDEKYYGSPK